MSESTAPTPRLVAQDQSQPLKRELANAPPVESQDNWQEISRAMWTKDTMTARAMPEISKLSLDEMLGLTASQPARPALPYTNPASRGPSRSDNSLIDWNVVNSGQKFVIKYGSLETPSMGTPRERLDGPNIAGPRGRMLEPVRDPAILARVPDAMYIGQSGKVTSTRNRSGDVQEYWLAGDAARAFAQAQQMLAAKGKQIIVEDKNGAGRTVDTQTEIYSRSHGGSQFAAGKPTSSNHTVGRAMDIANYKDPDVMQALRSVGFRQGDSRGPIAGDLHHFSFAGYPQTQMVNANGRRHHRRQA